MQNFLLQAVLTVVGLLVGGQLLLAGRRTLSVSLSMIVLATAANLLAQLYLGFESRFDLLYEGEWLLLIGAAALALAGFFLGRSRPEVAINLIGVVSGANIALWFNQINHYISVDVVGGEPETAVALTLLAALGLSAAGWWFVHVFRDEALIVITVVMGVELLLLSLRLDNSSSFTAVFLLSLALVGVVVQYADYVRSIKADKPLEPPAQPAVPELFSPYDWLGR